LRFIGQPVLSDDPCGSFGILAAVMVDIPRASKAVGGPFLLGFVALAGAGLGLVHLPDHYGKDKPDLDATVPVWQLKTTRTFSSSED
jgi:hypothetical protein